jgi:hypothetical protein
VHSSLAILDHNAIDYALIVDTLTWLCSMNGPADASNWLARFNQHASRGGQQQQQQGRNFDNAPTAERPDGPEDESSNAILVFLPGLKEITTLQEMLQNHRSFGRALVLPIHSTVPPDEQRLVFDKAPPNVRKIVLATNIAETAITISDGKSERTGARTGERSERKGRVTRFVGERSEHKEGVTRCVRSLNCASFRSLARSLSLALSLSLAHFRSPPHAPLPNPVSTVAFVIDTGRMKELRYDAQRKMSALEDVVVSRANARQRRGRAGRVREGVAIHLFTQQRHDNCLVAAQSPEVQRVPLEQLILRIKALK